MHAQSTRAKGLSEGDKVGIVQFAGDDASAVALPLHAAHVAKGTVVEDNRHRVDAVLTAVAISVAAKRKPPSPVTLRRAIGSRYFGAERGREAPTQRALIVGSEVGAGLIDRHGCAGNISDLGNLLDIDTVVRQGLTDGTDIRHLRLNQFIDCVHFIMQRQHLDRREGRSRS